MRTHPMVGWLAPLCVASACGSPSRTPVGNDDAVGSPGTTEQLASTSGALNVVFQIVAGKSPARPVMISIDGRDPQAVSLPIWGVSYDVKPGSHTIRLTLDQDDCSVSYYGAETAIGYESRNITIVPHVTYTVNAVVDCNSAAIPVYAKVTTSGPGSGSFAVTVSSTLFPTVRAQVAPEVPLGSVLIGYFHAGNYTISESVLSPNCQMPGIPLAPGSSTPWTTTVTGNALRLIIFYVMTCQ